MQYIILPISSYRVKEETKICRLLTDQKTHLHRLVVFSIQFYHQSNKYFIMLCTGKNKSLYKLSFPPVAYWLRYCIAASCSGRQNINIT